jgi:hypothetical protein
MTVRKLLCCLRLTLILGSGVLGFSAQAQLTILSQPASLLNLLNLGQNVTLSVTATSGANTNLNYQWKRNGVLIPGATNATLTLSSVQASDCGAFSVQISDGEDSVESIPTQVVPGFVNQLLGSLLSLVNGETGQIRSSNVGITNAGGIPALIPGVAPQHPVVCNWTPLLGGTVTFSTLGSDFDTVLGAYTMKGTNYVPVPTVVNDDDSGGYLSSSISFDVTGLTPYYIIVDGFQGATGDVLLTWTETLANILSPASYPTITAMPPIATTVAPGAPIQLSGQWENEDCVWLFNGQKTRVANTNVFYQPNAGDSAVGAYTAQVSGTGGLSSRTRPATVQLNILQDGTTATNSFAFNKFLDASGAAFAQPVPRQQHVKTGGSDSRGYTCSQTFSTVGSAEEPGEPSICGQIGGSPQWYAYVAPENGSLLIDTTGSSFNTMVGVYVGDGKSFNTLTNVGCGYTTNAAKNGQPVISVPNVVAGQTNYIQVDGYHGASGTAHLNIHLGNPVRIVIPPQNQAVAPSANATFTAVAMGATNISYTWMFNGTPISGATGPTLTVPNVQGSQTGTYSVVVSNLVSVAAASATLSLQVAPAITNQPSSQMVAVGDTATLTVGASGQPAPSYQWFWNGQPVGTNSATLSIANFQATNTGDYEVVVSNASGAVTSAVATLTVPSAPQLTNEPVSQIVVAGNAATLTAGATGLPLPSYQWLFNGQPIGTNSATLVISDFEAAKVGEYEVVVVNGSGSVTSAPAILSLPIAPLITNQPEGELVIIGETTSLTVGALGTPALSFQWLCNGQPVGTNSAMLTIANFQSTNAGVYQVVVSNIGGAVTSAPAMLVMPSAPLILQQPVSHTATCGAVASLSVVATGRN